MKILLISDASGYMRGGVITEIKHLIIGLQSRGHQVALAIDSVTPLKCDVQHFPMTLQVGKLMRQQVAHAVSKFQPNIIHIVCMSSQGVISLKPIINGYPWLLTIHSLPPHERKLSLFHGNEKIHYFARSLRFGINSLGWRWVFMTIPSLEIIVHSKFVKDAATGKGALTDAVTIVALPMEAEMASNDCAFKNLVLSSDTLKVTTVGGIAHTKGQHDVIKAMALLRNTVPRIIYNIIGEVRDISYLNYLKSLICEFKLSEKVMFYENIDDQKKNEILSSTDVYIQPSHEEGFCFAFLEAASLVPRIIGTDTGSIGKVCEHDIGAFLVSPSKPQQLANAILNLMAKELTSDLMQMRQQRLLNTFSVDVYLDAHETLYCNSLLAFKQTTKRKY